MKINKRKGGQKIKIKKNKGNIFILKTISVDQEGSVERNL